MLCNVCIGIEINLSEIFVIKVVIPKSLFLCERNMQTAEAKFFVPDIVDSGKGLPYQPARQPM
jgi:hypothetical protein